MVTNADKTHFGLFVIRYHVYALITVAITLSIFVAGYLFWQESKRYRMEEIANNYHLEAMLYATRIKEELLQYQLHLLENRENEIAGTGSNPNPDLDTQSTELIKTHLERIALLRKKYETNSLETNRIEPILDKLQRQFSEILRSQSAMSSSQPLPTSAPTIEILKGFSRSVEQLRRIHNINRENQLIELQTEKQSGYTKLVAVLLFSMLIGFLVSRGILSRIKQLFAEQQKTEARLRLSATVFESSSKGVVITDTNAKIVSVNSAFTDITGYAKSEVLGKDPSILKSGRHDPSFFKDMWSTLKQKDNWEGEIWDRRKNGEVYPKWQSISAVRDDDGYIINYVSIFSDISSIKQSHEQLQHLAHHDPLTGLPNRLLLNARLEQAIQHAHRYNRHIAVLFLDLDRFKQINDTLGHPAGDLLLQSVAERLLETTRKGDTVARLGGDELTVVLEGLHKTNNAIKVANTILEVLSKPFDLDGHEVFVSASIGISIYPQDGLDSGTLLQHADNAMYQAKQQGRGRYQFFEKSMTNDALEALTLETDLHRAFESNELILRYQPQTSLRSGEITGVEVLMHWDHPKKGTIPYEQVILIAEESDLMATIGSWILHTACAQAKVWQDEGMPPFRIAVNMSGQQLSSRDIIDEITEALTSTGLDPSYLELEIPEETFMKQTERMRPILEELRSMGITLAIDEFGAGYSSLSHLNKLPVDRLKVGRIFVQDIHEKLDNHALTRAIIALGHGLDIQVTAEGVDSQEQYRLLKMMGCDEVQGGHFNRAVPAETIPYLLTSKDHYATAAQ
ncbi:MAG: EAL domain-containing protein [Gammaproteobacteria bacterium]|nr:EAL domain-containing protein [Gammaproteobacteria bacterium]